MHDVILINQNYTVDNTSLPGHWSEETPPVQSHDLHRYSSNTMATKYEYDHSDFVEDSSTVVTSGANGPPLNYHNRSGIQPRAQFASIPDGDLLTEDDLQNKVCEFSFFTRRRHNLLHGSQVKKPSVICAVGSRQNLNLFFKTIAPNIKFKFTLVTLEHDDSVPPSVNMLETRLLVAWFGWNIAIIHKKLYALPIGLNKGRHLKNILAARKAIPHKNGRILVNFKLDRPERKSLWGESKSWGSLVDRIPYDQKGAFTSKGTVGLVTAMDYYQKLSKYSYVICPQGLGIDTHRLWEALYLQVIPIVKASSISSLYQGLPVIQVNNWGQFQPHGLPISARWDGDRLRLSYWVGQIRGSVQSEQ